MPAVKQIKSSYRDQEAIYTLIYYCLNHDLVDYEPVYLPVYQYVSCVTDKAIIKKEAERMSAFWNNMLDVYMHNYGKRLNHFVIGVGHGSIAEVQSKTSLILDAVSDFMRSYGLPGLVAYHLKDGIFHHIHILIGVINIYGESIYSMNISMQSLIWYLQKEYPFIKFFPCNNID